MEIPCVIFIFVFPRGELFEAWLALSMLRTTGPWNLKLERAVGTQLG